MKHIKESELQTLSEIGSNFITNSKKITSGGVKEIIKQYEKYREIETEIEKLELLSKNPLFRTGCLTHIKTLKKQLP
jgi:hypothetical protein